MQKYIFLIGLMALCHIQFVAGQDYRTLRVNGTILIEKSNAALERGTVFEESDNLLFKSYNSIATVLNEDKGRYILRPDNTDLAYAKASYTPAMSNISSRSGHIMTPLDFKNHFEGKYLLFHENRVKVNRDVFAMNEDKFFFARYDYQGQTINKKLAFSSDTLLLNKTDLFSIDGEPIKYDDISLVEIWYMEQDINNKSSLIAGFEPIVADNTDLLQEIEVLFEVFENRTFEEKLEEALSFINEFYASPNKDSFIAWLKSHKLRK